MSLPSNVLAQVKAQVIFTRDHPNLRQIVLAGYEWLMKSSMRVGPGPNLFSETTNSICLDALDRLHLRITNRNSRWQCAKILTRRTFVNVATAAIWTHSWIALIAGSYSASSLTAMIPRTRIGKLV
jgi:hypothetical protein